METSRTRAYWPTRIMLAAAIIGPPATLFWFLMLQPGTMGPRPDPLYGVGGAAFLVFGAGLWLAGVIWMIRIFRGPSDKPPTWRYRHR